MTTKVWYEIRDDRLRMLQYSDMPDGRSVSMRDGTRLMVHRHEIIPDEAFVDISEPVELLDELLKAGYRPTDNKWTGGHVKALENHIGFAELVAKKLLERDAS